MPEFALKFIIQGFFCQGSLSNFVKYFTILFNKFYPLALSSLHLHYIYLMLTSNGDIKFLYKLIQNIFQNLAIVL